jgi:tetratricopeptide (TPR) repeat protein
MSNPKTEKYCKVKKLDFLDFPKNRAEFHYGRADTLLKEGKNTTLELERICIELTRSCALKPREVKNFLGLAECFRRACDSSSAIFSLRFALQLHPNSTFVKQQLGELLINRAQELMKLGKHYNKASKYFEEALTLDGSRDNIWLLRCVCEINCKEFETALLCINRTINLSTDDCIDSYILRAKIHWAMGNMDIGNKDMRKAMVFAISYFQYVLSFPSFFLLCCVVCSFVFTCACYN